MLPRVQVAYVCMAQGTPLHELEHSEAQVGAAISAEQQGLGLPSSPL